MRQVILHDRGYDQDQGSLTPGFNYFPEGEWMVGDNDTLLVTHNYRVKVGESSDAPWTLRTEGQAANPLYFQKQLVQGWNSMGYLPQGPLPVDDALRHLADEEWVTASTVNIIKSRYDGFAMYAGNGHWVGSLTTLEPGKGYRLYLAEVDLDFPGKPVGLFEWPLAGSDLGFRSTEEQFTGVAQGDESQWGMDVRMLSGSMNAIVRLDVNSSAAQSLDDKLGAFITDDTGEEHCIGQMQPMDTEQGLLYFMTMFEEPENGRNIRFKWHNALTETEWVADDILAFEAGGSEGTLDAPFILHFSKADEVDLESAGHLMAYPNPFNNELVIHWHGTEPLKDLVIEDSRGRRVADLSCNDILNGPCRWNAAGIEGGVYFIHATTETRNYTLRVVK
jgi:hypothetical protein